MRTETKWIRKKTTTKIKYGKDNKGKEKFKKDTKRKHINAKENEITGQWKEEKRVFFISYIIIYSLFNFQRGYRRDNDKTMIFLLKKKELSLK